MDERTYLQWNVPTWITVFLMATIGFLVMGLVAQAALNMTANVRGS